jgi:hypothetical protein
VVAGAADQIVQAGSLAAHHQNAVAGQVELVVVAASALVQADNPQILPLQLFQGAHQIDHPRNAQVLGGSGAGLDGDRAQRGRTALGEHHAVHPGAIGHAQQSAQVLRVFNAIQSQQQASRSGLVRFGLWRRKEVLDREELLRADQGHHALVSGGLRQLRQLLAALLADADAALAAKGHQPLQAGIFALAGHQDVVKAPPSGLDGLFYRVQSVQNFHKG